MCKTNGCTRHNYRLSDGTLLSLCGPCWFKTKGLKAAPHGDKEVIYDGDGRPLYTRCFKPYTPRVPQQRICGQQSCRKAANLERTLNRRDRLRNEQ